MLKPAGGRFFSWKLTSVGSRVKMGPKTDMAIKNMINASPATESWCFFVLSQ
jgi:hypothetical protein